jgi:hypothetical protein
MAAISAGDHHRTAANSPGARQQGQTAEEPVRELDRVEFGRNGSFH